jgi:glycosyltransferase involved in cell wall biosynthesis
MKAGGRQKLLFCALKLGPNGGGACVTAWALQALQRDWDVTILCGDWPDFAGFNRMFGTRLEEGNFEIRQLPFPLRHLDKIDPDPYSIQRLAWLMRYCQSRVHAFDAVVSTDDEFDYGRPGVQYVHFPHMKEHFAVIKAAEGLSRGQRLWRLLTGRLRPWLWVSDIRYSRLQQNRMVTNSHWTAAHIRELYGVEPVVVYPPVRWSAPPVEWARRSYAFASLGRLSPDKRLMQVIDILERVRSRGFDIELDMAGLVDDRAGPGYIEKLQARIEQAGDWIRLHRSPSRSELESIVSNCRYGIHAFQDEHFGIAVAELVRAGCIVFVPDNGGQVEIVGEQSALRYRSDEDAVDKICNLLADDAEQARLRAALAEQAARFGEDQFMDGMRDVVAGLSREQRAGSG